MRVNIEGLGRLAYNSLLYAKKGDIIRWHIISDRVADTMSVLVKDGYVALWDTLSLDMDSNSGHPHPGTFYLAQADVKEMEKWLRDLEGTVEFVRSDGHITLVSSSDPTAVTSFPEQSDDAEVWDRYTRMMLQADFKEQPIRAVAVNPDRLRKLSLVRPGDAPIDMLTGWDNREGREVIHFKIGPTVRGLIAPLDREELSKIYQNGELW